ncbi:MAG TPA: hypothetical protein VHB98_10540, partial [Chloroflexota bacterium]|nr:hypothetical protein [Chloroflexota bacterium]
TMLGTKVVQGQVCRGYRFLDTDAGTQETLWIGVATQLPVQMTIGQGSASRTGSSASGSTTLTWSDWNDPSLKIPAVYRAPLAGRLTPSCTSNRRACARQPYRRA